MVVVPPHAAARVPVSNVSMASVPPNGSSKWVWASIPPGITYLPVASMTVSTDAATSVPRSSEPGCSTATMVSPSMSDVGGAAAGRRDDGAVLDECGGHVGRPRRLRDPGVRVGPAVAVELPVVAHLEHHRHVEVAHEHLLVLARTALADEVAARVDHLARAVEVDREVAVLVVLAPDTVGLQHEVAVGDRRARAPPPPTAGSTGRASWRSG